MISVKRCLYIIHILTYVFVGMAYILVFSRSYVTWTTKRWLTCENKNVLKTHFKICMCGVFASLVCVFNFISFTHTNTAQTYQHIFNASSLSLWSPAYVFPFDLAENLCLFSCEVVFGEKMKNF